MTSGAISENIFDTIENLKPGRLLASKTGAGFFMEIDQLVNRKSNVVYAYFNTTSSTSALFSTGVQTALFLIEPSACDIVRNMYLHLQITCSASAAGVALPLPFWINNAFISDESSTAYAETLLPENLYMENILFYTSEQYATLAQALNTSTSTAAAPFDLAPALVAGQTYNFYLKMPSVYQQSKTFLPALRKKIQWNIAFNPLANILASGTASIQVNIARIIVEGINLRPDISTALLNRHRSYDHVYRVSLRRQNNPITLGPGVVNTQLTTQTFSSINGAVEVLACILRTANPTGANLLRFYPMTDFRLIYSDGSYYNSQQLEDVHLRSIYMAANFPSISPSVTEPLFASGKTVYMIPINENPKALMEFGKRSGATLLDGRSTLSFYPLQAMASTQLIAIAYMQGTSTLTRSGEFITLARAVDQSYKSYS